MDKNIVVINWAGLNYGDNELFKLIYNRYLKDKYNNVYVFSDSEELLFKDQKIKYIDRSIGRKKRWNDVLKCLKGSKKVICGGGDIIRGEIGTSLLLLLAAYMKKEIAIIGVGVIEIESRNFFIMKLKEWMLKKVLKKSKLICVRDSESYEVLRRYSDNVYNSIDMCFIYELENKSDLNTKKEGKYIAVSLIPPSRAYKNNWTEELYKECAKYFDTLIDRYNIYPIFLVGTLDNKLKENNTFIDGDDVVVKSVLKYMRNKVNTDSIRFVPDYEEASKLIGRCMMYFGFRLHYTITSIINRKPVIAVNYAKKIEEVLKTIELDEYVFDIEQVKADELLQRTEKILTDIDREEEFIECKMKKCFKKINKLDNYILDFINN